MKFEVHEVALPLLHPFNISRGSTTVQSAIVVELSDGRHSGFGEASANDYYGVTAASMRATLESLRPEIEEFACNAADNETAPWPERLWGRLDSKLGQCRFSQCALDEAAHDLWGKQIGQPLWRAWGLDPAAAAPSDYTIGIDTIEHMLAKLREFADWPAYKIKLGTPHDLEICARLRQATAAPLRVDANCGWNVEETLANARAMAPLGVELIEQPLPADDRAGARRLFVESPLPIFADESCRVEADVAAAVGHFHGVNIKLQKCGGLTPARRMIAQARRLGPRVMIGCMNESTVGISAAAQLAPLVDFADLDGAALLAQDIASGVRIEQGRVRYPVEHGAGVRLWPRE